ncbi:RING/U-box superfamily protein [Capsicum annuum]|nr:RING/U-box superfamily protein [Capsicum annuum]
MKRDVTEFMAKCSTCQQVKIEHQKPSGSMQEFTIPTWKWEEVNMDFVKGLPRTRHPHDSVWVIIDRMTKSAQFLPIHTSYSTEDYAKLFIRELVRLHSVPLSIISDREVVRDAHDIVAIWNDHVIEAMQFPPIKFWGYLYPKTIAVYLEPCHVSRYPNSSYDSIDFSQSCDSGKPHDLSQLSDISNILPVNGIQVPTILIEYPPDKGYSQAIFTRGTVPRYELQPSSSGSSPVAET